MKILRYSLLLICLTSLSSTLLVAQENSDLPAVFMIGEHELPYEKLVAECSVPLLKVCDESMDEAYAKWLGVLKDIETYADTTGFDIKGSKLWINIYWNANGTIKNLVYYPKTNSKNMDFSLMTAFFERYLSEQTVELKYETCFSHAGSVNFPTHADYYLGSK